MYEYEEVKGELGWSGSHCRMEVGQTTGDWERWICKILHLPGSTRWFEDYFTWLGGWTWMLVVHIEAEMARKM